MKLLNIILKYISVLLMAISIGGYFVSPFFGLPVSSFFFIFSVLVFCVSCNNENSFKGDLFCNIVLIGLILFNIPGYIWYYCGSRVLSDTGSIDLWIFLLLVRPSLLVLFIVFIIYLLIRFHSGYYDSGKICLLLLFAIVLACSIKFYIYESSEKLFLRGMAKTVNAQLDTSSILKWLPQHQVPSREPEIPRSSYYLKGVEGVGRVPVIAEEQPEYIKQFTNNNDTYVLYSWQKKTFYILRDEAFISLHKLRLPFTEWGIVIGLSPHDISEKISEDISDGSRVVLQISDNVYVWFSRT